MQNSNTSILEIMSAVLDKELEAHDKAKDIESIFSVAGPINQARVHEIVEAVEHALVSK